MNTNLVSWLWELPGVQRFFHEVEEDLRSGRTLWILFPEGADLEAFLGTLSHYLGMERLMDLTVLNLAEAGEVSPLAFFRQALGLPTNGSLRSLTELVSGNGIPEVILLKNYEDLPASLKRQWSEELNRWAQACHSTGARKSLCILTPARSLNGAVFPSQDVRLGVRFWPGVPSALEMRLLCRLASPTTDALGYWREHVIASLAGNDLALAECLWDVSTGAVDEIRGTLESYARSRRWIREEVQRGLRNWRPAPSGVEVRLHPQAASLPLYSHGWITYSPEQGEEIHSAALCLLERENEILHRLWRAQAALLLTPIDEVRLKICETLTTRYGLAWPRLGNQEGEPPLELGKLEIVLKNARELYRERDRWLRVVSLARKIRNDLAHYSPISYAEYLDFWELSRRVHGI